MNRTEINRRSRIGHSCLPLMRMIVARRTSGEDNLKKLNSLPVWVLFMAFALASWFFDWKEGGYLAALIFVGLILLRYLYEQDVDKAIWERAKVQQRWNAEGLCACCLTAAEQGLTKSMRVDNFFFNEDEWSKQFWEHLERDMKFEDGL